jgi:hypothetical protein
LVGHTLFGVDALRYDLLPRWNVLPLMVGLTAPLLILLSMIIESASGLDRSQVEVTLVTLYSSITGLWWVLMGIAMMGQKREPQLTLAV